MRNPTDISLRDYYAAHALMAIVAKTPFLTLEDNRAIAAATSYGEAARGAYAYADAMLALRDRKSVVNVNARRLRARVRRGPRLPRLEAAR